MNKFVYKLAFVNELRDCYEWPRLGCWWKSDLKVLFDKHNMPDVYITKIKKLNKAMWTASEVFAALEKIS